MERTDLSELISQALSELSTSRRLSASCILVDVASARFGRLPVLVSLKFGISSAFVQGKNVSLQGGDSGVVIQDNANALVNAGLERDWAIEVALCLAGFQLDDNGKVIHNKGCGTALPS
jgi:hypothetical protein